MVRSRIHTRSCAPALVALAIVLNPFAALSAAAQTAADSGRETPAWVLAVSDLARIESWRFFAPRARGGEPVYAFLGNRLRFEVQRRWPKAELLLTAQHVGFAGLPENATGPGPLGTGALYFDQGGGRRAPQQLYLRYAHARLVDVAPGLDVQIGRMAYTSGAEAPSGVPKIESVKRLRLDARLVGEFEWSLYQRGFDGARVDFTRPRWKVTALALAPTQGGFARVAGPSMTDIIVSGATVSSRPAAPPGPRTQLQGFGWHYADHRAVTQRPDNTGLAATAADIDVTTAGATLVGAYPAARGEVDAVGWAAVQRGSWYGQDHAAFAVAGEAGYQWATAPGRPWVRGGFFYASGDDDGRDRRHETFFPMLPTVRRFAQTTVYSTMNLRDSFVQLLARPRPALAIRLDVHRLDLAAAGDLWYAGSGATLGRGASFGYAGRRSSGRTRLGTSVEASADYAVTPRWSINGFVGHLAGGDVVDATFAGDRLWFAYLEHVVRVDFRR